MSRYPTSLALFLLGVWLLLVQPGAIPLGYAAARRRRRRGGHPMPAALGSWLGGCVLGALSSAALAGVGIEPTWLMLLLSYLPLWLLAWLVGRRTPAPEGVDDRPPDR